MDVGAEVPNKETVDLVNEDEPVRQTSDRTADDTRPETTEAGELQPEHERRTLDEKREDTTTGIRSKEEELAERDKIIEQMKLHLETMDMELSQKD